MKSRALLLRAQLRFLSRSPWSTATVLLGVALGVASVVAVHQLNVRVNDALSLATPAHLSGVTHLLDRGNEQTTAEDYFELRRRWRAGEHPGVTSLIPVVEGQLLEDGRRIRVFATDWLAASGLQTNEALRGLAMVGRDAVVADAALGLEAGDEIVLGGLRCVVLATVQGGLGSAVFSDIGTGQEILGRDPDQLDYVAAVREDPLAAFKDVMEQALPGSSAGFALPETWEVARWRVRSVSTELPTLGFARSILFNLGALGTLTLVVAWFLIHQVAVVWYRQRRPLMERLHLVGVSSALLNRHFIFSFALIGVVATVLGLLLGPTLAVWVSPVPASDEVGNVAPWALFKGAASGIGVSVLGAWMACRPMSWRLAPRLLLLGMLGLILAVGLRFEGSGLVGAFAAVLALCLLGVLMVRPLLVKTKVRRQGRLGSLRRRIGLREVAWHPAESAVAVGALGLAVGAGMGIGVMVESFRGDFVRMLDQRLAHEVFVTTGGRDLIAAYGWLAARAPIHRGQLYGEDRLRIGGFAVSLGYTDFAAEEALRYGFPRALDAGEVLVSQRLARSLGVAAGSVLRVDSAGVASGDAAEGRSLRVVGEFPGFGEPGLRALVDTATAVELGVPVTFDRASLTGVDDQLLDTWVEAFPWLTLQSRTQMRQRALDIFDQTFAITRSLTLLSLLVAAIGMYNALLALRLNQVRSEQLLQALGITSGERRTLSLMRALMVGGLACAVALPVGLGMAYLLCEVVNPRAFGWKLSFAPTLMDVAVPLLLAVAVALVTGLLPAPRSELQLAEVEGV